ncbi:MAG: hypothetical protein JNM88_19400 [Chitinophagaceae bacterium]|nr:hypothetical protein [Chitinophagaceae bacterium]
MIFHAGLIEIALEKGPGHVMLYCGDQKLLFANQDEETLRGYVLMNFRVVKDHYQARGGEKLTEAESDELCLIIVFHWLYLYNMWRGLYPKEKDRPLEFDEKDFEHPYTYDEIIWFVKRKYKADYLHRSSALLGMTEEACRDYEKRRQEFHDMF